MFRRARLRLTVLNIVLFALVLAVFSLVFYVAFATVLAPTFDPEPDLTNDQVAAAAYQATLERIGLALVVGDVAVTALVGLIAWVLAGRTLGPIREAHARQRRFVADASHEMRTPSPPCGRRRKTRWPATRQPRSCVAPWRPPSGPRNALRG